MSNIRYDWNNKTVTQTLEVFASSMYDFEKPLKELIKDLKIKLVDYTARYIKTKTQITETDCFGRGQYEDGSKVKEVKFDELILDSQPKRHEDGNDLMLCGRRDIYPEELEAHQKKMEGTDKETRERELELLKKLKEKYEK